jgi:hypothetical protein
MLMTQAERDALIAKIEALPGLLESTLAGVPEPALLQPYREGGWNARQVVHHLADSHMSAFLRAKKVVNEENPTLQPYDQDVWAAQADGSTGPLEPSLQIIRGVHARWAAFLRSLPETAWSRTGFHPERGPLTLEDLLRIYSGHGEKHVGHIRQGIGAA